MGDVNSGAEIVADRQRHHLGAAARSGACRRGRGRKRGGLRIGIVPTQLRIAGEIAVSPKKQGKSQPEVARLKDGHLQAEPWHELTGR